MSKIVPLTLSARIDEDYDADEYVTWTTVQILMGDTVVFDYRTDRAYRDDDAIDDALSAFHQQIQPTAP